jgi:hypothetical protein
MRPFPNGKLLYFLLNLNLNLGQHKHRTITHSYTTNICRSAGHDFFNLLCCCCFKHDLLTYFLALLFSKMLRSFYDRCPFLFWYCLHLFFTFSSFSNTLPPSESWLSYFHSKICLSNFLSNPTLIFSHHMPHLFQPPIFFKYLILYQEVYIIASVLVYLLFSKPFAQSLAYTPSSKCSPPTYVRSILFSKIQQTDANGTTFMEI